MNPTEYSFLHEKQPGMIPADEKQNAMRRILRIPPALCRISAKAVPKTARDSKHYSRTILLINRQNVKCNCSKPALFILATLGNLRNAAGAGKLGFIGGEAQPLPPRGRGPSAARSEEVLRKLKQQMQYDQNKNISVCTVLTVLPANL